MTPDPIRLATEGAPWGRVQAHGLLPDAVIVGDDAGRFNVGIHALRWIHAERLIHGPTPFTPDREPAQERVCHLAWWLYDDRWSGPKSRCTPTVWRTMSAAW